MLTIFTQTIIVFFLIISSLNWVIELNHFVMKFIRQDLKQNCLEACRAFCCVGSKEAAFGQILFCFCLGSSFCMYQNEII